MNDMLKSLKEPITAEKLKILLPTIILGFQSMILALVLFAPKAYFDCKVANILIAEVITFIPILLQINYIAVSIASSVIMFFLYYLNEYVLASRGRPINYLDIYCIDDALKVANQYPLIINVKIVLLFLLTAAVTAISCVLIKKFFPPKEKRRYVKIVFPGISILLSVILFIIYTFNGFFEIASLTWDEPLYIRTLGLLYGIFSEYRFSIIKAPDGYSANAAKAILEEYEAKNIPVSDNEPPTNIIVIMNESFTDFSLIGEPDFTADPLPGIHSLSSNNIVKGRMAVNIYGGSTCNTEYEFITGLPLAFLPKNTMPFTQFRLESSVSEIWAMTAQGYSCTPLHGYFGNEYKRDKIYANFFENEFISAEKFTGNFIQREGLNIFDISSVADIPTFGDDLEYINRFISDAECYRKIESIMKNDNENGKSSFTFTVTMQNHGAYSRSEGFEKIIFADDDSADSIEYNNFLTLTSISDQAFIDFLHRLKEYPERTVVIIFGDHQPSLFLDMFKSKFSDSGNDYQVISDNYIVPYIAWANYDVDWDLPEIISANYLLTAVKASCGIELSPMDKLRCEAMNQYPVITWNFAVNADGEFVEPKEPFSSDIIQKYNIAEHYKLFDSDG